MKKINTLDTILAIMILLIVVLVGFCIWGPELPRQKERRECQDQKNGTWLEREQVCIAIPRIKLSK
jgi:hypothetical protein